MIIQAPLVSEGPLTLVIVSTWKPDVLHVHGLYVSHQVILPVGLVAASVTIMVPLQRQFELLRLSAHLFVFLQARRPLVSPGTLVALVLVLIRVFGKYVLHQAGLAVGFVSTVVAADSLLYGVHELLAGAPGVIIEIELVSVGLVAHLAPEGVARVLRLDVPG